MKKADIAMIVLIAAIAVMVAFGIGSRLSFLAPPKEGVQVRTVEEITSDVTAPSKEVFTSESINPTVQTVISRDAQ